MIRSQWHAAAEGNNWLNVTAWDASTRAQFRSKLLWEGHCGWSKTPNCALNRCRAEPGLITFAIADRRCAPRPTLLRVIERLMKCDIVMASSQIMDKSNESSFGRR